MTQRIGAVSILVNDYDEAIAYFTAVLGFQLVEDKDLGNAKRWVLVAPPDANGACLLLARAVNDDQRTRVGNQTGGRVFLFLHTDDFWRDYQLFKARGVVFESDPLEQPYGTVAVFRDLYGNRWDLLQLTADAAE